MQLSAAAEQVMQLRLQYTHVVAVNGPYCVRQLAAHVVPLNTFPRLHELHYAFVGPVQAEHCPAHVMQTFGLVVIYVPPGQVVTQPEL